MGMAEVCTFFDKLENNEIMGRNTYRFQGNFVFLPCDKLK